MQVGMSETKRIKEHLNLLIGLPLFNAGRVSSLIWFDFGKKISKIKDRKGKTLLIGEYAIHTESAWHIRGTQGIIVGSTDRFYSAGEDPYKDYETVDWQDKAVLNRCDERLKNFINEHKNDPLIVRSVDANRWGSIKINLSGKFAIEVFKHNSLGGEYWRMLETRKKGNKHFVVNSDEIYYD
jgi:hypothetical protein